MVLYHERVVGFHRVNVGSRIFFFFLIKVDKHVKVCRNIKILPREWEMKEDLVISARNRMVETLLKHEMSVNGSTLWFKRW